MASESKYDGMLKLLLIGNSGVGKSCLLMQFSENKFTNNFYNTIGVDYKVKYIDADGKRLKLQIWDTAGQDRFKTITSSYYRGAQGIVIVYDITDRISFDNVKIWLGEIEKYADEKVFKFLVGNKCDLEDRRKVSYHEGNQLATQLGIQFFETSAKSATGVRQTFDSAASTILRNGGVKFNKANNSTHLEKLLKEKEREKYSNNCCH